MYAHRPTRNGRTLHFAFLLSAIPVAAACAGSGAGADAADVPAPSADAGAPSAPDSEMKHRWPAVGVLITAERIRQSGARTAWEALDYTVQSHRFRSDARGRPRRIEADRGIGSLVLREEPLVFLDRTRLVDIEVLNQFPAHEIHSIRVLNGTDGTTYYGTSAVAGVILIRTIGAPPYPTDDPDDPATERESGQEQEQEEEGAGTEGEGRDASPPRS